MHAEEPSGISTSQAVAVVSPVWKNPGLRAQQPIKGTKSMGAVRVGRVPPTGSRRAQPKENGKAHLNT